MRMLLVLIMAACFMEWIAILAMGKMGGILLRMDAGCIRECLILDRLGCRVGQMRNYFGLLRME